MSGYFQKEIGQIKQMVLSLGTMVENRVQMLRSTIDALDGDLARRIIEKDFEIDQMEIDVEEECLKALALYQPVAVDLRFMETNRRLPWVKRKSSLWMTKRTSLSLSGTTF